MKIKYSFITGETLEIEVASDIGCVIASIEHDQTLRDRAETRRHASYEALAAVGFNIADKMAGPDAVIERKESIAEYLAALAKLRDAVALLLPQQQELVRKVFFAKRSIAGIAAEEGVGESAIRDRLKRIYKKLEKFMK